MAQVHSIHLAELKPGVTAQEVEKFIKQEWSLLTPYPGWKLRLFKADRGDRDGKYILLMDIESVEARNRFFPKSGEASDEATQFGDSHPGNSKVMNKLWTLLDGKGFTDYVEIE